MERDILRFRYGTYECKIVAYDDGLYQVMYCNDIGGTEDDTEWYEEEKILVEVTETKGEGNDSEATNT